ncbi:MAG: bifunctional riboflavin kinase/FAD synthetase [Clostridia bacterium]|nr:bifunctional riboflavin kinase/FAD synthetase [Clostridia bacterium]
MLVYENADVQLKSNTVVALGCFDGVHIGHKAVIDRAKQVALSSGLPLTVLTFSEPPRNFFYPFSTPLICSKAEKLKLLVELGADIIICLPLSEKILSISPKDFINDILASRLKAQHIVCGYNYTFGKNASGNTSLLQNECGGLDIEVSIVPKMTYNREPVSSSLIRQYISEGNTTAVSELLGRPFSITSTVVQGQHLARRLGFPTVNILPPQDTVLPKNGVYATRVRFDNKIKFGITNIGIRPTVNTKITCAETHIFDFDGNLYEKELTVDFLHFLRQERKFESVEEMALQVKKDIKLAQEYIEKTKH